MSKLLRAIFPIIGFAAGYGVGQLQKHCGLTWPYAVAILISFGAILLAIVYYYERKEVRPV